MVLPWVFLPEPAIGSTYRIGVRGKSVLQVGKALDNDGTFSVVNKKIQNLRHSFLSV